MSIDQLTENRINIKELTITEPATRVPFVPERDISNHLWKKWLGGLQKQLTTNLREGYVLAANMLILAPNKRDELALSSFEDDQEIIQTLGVLEKKILFPQEPAIKLTESAESLHARLEDIEDYERISETWIPMQIWNVFILHPDNFSQVQKIEGLFENLFSNAEIFKTGGNLNAFALIKTACKLVDPENTTISPEEWEKMYNTLEEETDIYKQVQLATYMKILAADTIDMTPEGLKITMPQAEFSEKKQFKMPEVRRF
jgi:hypothetical protein